MMFHLGQYWSIVSLSARRALPTVGPLPPTLSVCEALNQYNPKFDPAIVP
jgi:hypothetical protein